MAAAGLGSRRAIEAHIAAGDVQVNGEPARVGQTVATGEVIAARNLARMIAAGVPTVKRQDGTEGWPEDVDEDFPILAGKIIKVRAGMELAYRNDRPVAILKGVSIMGVPVPSAWLGGMKNIDLVEYYGGESGFWKSFADGVDNIRIRDGYLTVLLKE